MYSLLHRLRTTLQSTPRYLYSFRVFCIGLLALGLVVALSHSPLPVADLANDKIQHATAFFIFAALFHLAWPRSFWLFVFAPLLAYGGLIEIFQGMTTWRSMSWGDVVADATGLLLYYAVYKLIITKQITSLSRH